MLETAKQVSAFLPGVKFIFLCADEAAHSQIEKGIQEAEATRLNTEIHTGYQLTHLCRCDLALVASGSATLECCVAGVPMLILYKAHPITFWVGQNVFRIGLHNLSV